MDAERSLLVVGGAAALAAAALGGMLLVGGNGGESATPANSATRRTSSAATTAPAPGALEFSGVGDRRFPPLDVRQGARLHWRISGLAPVFTLFDQDARLVDSVARAGSVSIPPGHRRLLQLVASGRWSVTIEGASLRGGA
jgi:hypothetical protein